MLRTRLLRLSTNLSDMGDPASATWTTKSLAGPSTAAHMRPVIGELRCRAKRGGTVVSMR